MQTFSRRLRMSANDVEGKWLELVTHPPTSDDDCKVLEMATNTKTFDCAEMKKRIQAERMAEYESRKDEFASFLDFVRARNMSPNGCDRCGRHSAGEDKRLPVTHRGGIM